MLEEVCLCPSPGEWKADTGEGWDLLLWMLVCSLCAEENRVTCVHARARARVRVTT